MSLNSLGEHNESELFLRDKQAWENAITAYSGADPLELWYNYICWFDYNLHIDPENKFKETLEKCLSIFEHNDCYKQDIRMIKLWVKYIDLQSNPLKLYQILYQRGIGTQCACFYISWAHYYDSANAFREAESVYNLGFQARADPYTELQEAHTKFRLSVSQRMLYNDSSSKKRSANHLSEQRQQITNLNPSAKKSRVEVNEFKDHSQQLPQSNINQLSNYNPPAQPLANSKGTNYIQDNVIKKSPNPTNQMYITNNVPPSNYSQGNINYQTYSNSQHSNQSQIFKSLQNVNQGKYGNNLQDTNHIQALGNVQIPVQAHSYENISNHDQTSNHTQSLNNALTSNQTVNSSYSHSSFTSSSPEQCNLNNSAYVISSSLKYIYGDGNVSASDETNHKEEYCLQNVKVPSCFARYCKNNYETWKPALFLEEPHDPNRKCIYQKHLVYPGDGSEYSPEEIRSRKWIKHLALKLEKQIPILKNGDSGQKARSDKNNLNSDNKLEEQIEASTIRFSTDADGLTKNKTITIKFRREKPTNHNKSDITTDYQSDGESKTQAYSCTIQNKQKSSKNSTEEGTGDGSYTEKSIQRQTPKIKKVKRIKIVNNYDDPKYMSSSKSNSSTDYCDQINSYKSTSGISRNEYEDANLLLSFANISNDSNEYPNYSSMHPSFNDDYTSYTELNSSFNENSYLNGSNSSTPKRKLSQSCSKTSTPQYTRTLKRLTSSTSLQNDDSECSYEQNSFFAAEQDEVLKSRRLEKAQITIDLHLSKAVIDPFSSELCKAFLTKLNFPSCDTNGVNRLINTPIPKLANTKSAVLADVTYAIEKEVGRGSYGSVYKAINNNTGGAVALKLQKPPNTWELYICSEVRKRITNYDILPGFMDISAAIIAPNASILITEFSGYGSLLDINNKLRQATKKVMHESLVMHFSSQILNIVSHLHACKIIHADIKPDNFLLMKVPSSDSHIPSLRLIDFGCAIDMSLYPEKTEFKKVIQTDGFTCIEMQEGRPWSYQTDLFCIAGTVHVMLFGEYMQLVRKFDQWDIKQKLPRYLKKIIWTEFFCKMLNIKDAENLPDLIQLKILLDEEVRKMDSELQTQIRTLSNLLHRR